ncbi:GcrA family cell cycle regulator [Brevundimonas staleyi]|uniref:GcrA family cell cycle regulator n=1 Tax=Brevundimonas staleyi TaxID=74326 RepID=A0ABW0FW56_9CAUL
MTSDSRTDTRTHVLTVSRSACRWPIGEPGHPDFAVCGGARVRGAYCDCHGAIAYRRPRETANSLERLASLV